jgi:heme-degrading monooxygenase HmoA
MIARTWRAVATVEGAEGYERHFRDSVLPGLRALNGFLGAYLMRREASAEVEIRVLTLWASLDAIREFAGDDITGAVVEPEAQAVLISYDGTVAHYHVVEAAGSAEAGGGAVGDLA